ncbi:MAG TPA: glycosyltransferase [Hyalangium sp.]|nr:glycosyltransferase [Hyalangium sp.]HYI00471.1 glycosyltransferase [Hyalangium sp.]
MSDLPRLLLCSFDVIPGPSGSSRRLTEYLKALPDRFSVVVLSAKTPDHSHIEKYQGARLLRVPVGAGNLASRIQAFERAVKRQLDSEDYALAHFTDPFGGYVLCEMKGDYGYRLIYEAQTFPSQELRYTHPQTEGDKRFLAKVRRQELFCLMNADLVITGSETTRTYIQSLGASTDQTRVMRAPVDVGPYTPDVLGAPDGQPMRLMYLGSQAGWQGVPTLLRALALAVEQGAEVKLTLVGPRHPDWQPHLEDLAKELGIQEQVEFQPPVLHDDLVKVLALADVGVLPLDDVDRNRLQGGPLAKTSEYLAAGRPVLAADLPVTRELLPSSATIFHPPGDAKALADCISELARDVPRRVELGREARAFAEHELDAGLIRGKLLDIYDELLGKQHAGGARSEMPELTTTGTPTNRLPEARPPEGGRRTSRGGRSAADKASASSKKGPARDDLPLVLGQALSDDGMDTRLVKTEPDAHSIEPPVVMGLPLRDQKSAVSARREDSTPIVRPPPGVRREEPEEPPTSIVHASPPTSRDDTSRTPIVRSPLGAASEAPVASSARASAPLQAEEPPAPTPIVPMKPPGGRAAGASRSEPGPSRPAAAAASPSTGTRGALQEPPPASPSTSSRAALQESPPASPSTSSRAALQEPPAAGPSTSSRAALQEPKPVSPSTSSRAALQEPPPTTPSTSSRSALQEPARVQESSEKGRPAALPPLTRPGPPSSENKGPPPRLSPVEAPVARSPVPTPPAAQAPEEEPEEISEEEAQEISDDAALDAAPTPPHPRPRMEEPEELSSDELEEADAAEALEAADDQVEEADDAAEPLEDEVQNADDAVEEVDDMVEPVDAVLPAAATPLPKAPVSALDPWFAQVAHGYCPPEGAQFARHTPPTNFPGRDEEPTDPSRAVLPPPAQGASRANRS